jgi:hypothetical protein
MGRISEHTTSVSKPQLKRAVGRYSLRWITEKSGVGLWTGNCTSTGPTAEFCEYGNETPGFLKERHS